MVSAFTFLSAVSAAVISFEGQAFSSYSPSNDAGTATLSGDGHTVVLSGNSWKSMPLPYSVTADTIISFDFKADENAEHFSIGLDNHNGSNPLLHLPVKFGGAHNGGQYAHEPLGAENRYVPGSGWRRYELAVGSLYGSFVADRIFFVRDADSVFTVGEASFRNVRVYEKVVPQVQEFADVQVYEDAVIDGDLTVSGSLYLTRPQGDVSMGVYGK